jgi:hypothetical protein
MGTVPIPVISPLIIARSDDPVLEPPQPISRVEPSSGNSGGNPDDAYSPTHPESSPDSIPPDSSTIDAEAQPSPTDSDPAHQINLFA